MALDDEWMARGNCTNLPGADKIFFPVVPKGANGLREYAPAKAICKDCPVRVYCLSYAIAHKIPYGVWGGTTQNERQRIPKAARREIRRAWRDLYPVTNQLRA